jgi:hypothetical protein
MTTPSWALSRKGLRTLTSVFSPAMTDQSKPASWIAEGGSRAMT